MLVNKYLIKYTTTKWYQVITIIFWMFRRCNFFAKGTPSTHTYNLALIIRPLQVMLKKNAPVWPDLQTQAVKTIKEKAKHL